jgi:hypothetical protein
MAGCLKYSSAKSSDSELKLLLEGHINFKDTSKIVDIRILKGEKLPSVFL